MIVAKMKILNNLYDAIFGKECPRCKERWHFDGYECSICGYDVAIAEWNRMYYECIKDK